MLNQEIYYIQKDYLGSYYCVTDERGEIVLLNDREEQIYSFDPWGRRRNPRTWDYGSIQTEFLFDRGFTGHEHLDKFDLINMNGRVYDPWVGRMLSPDPFVQSPSYSQSYNRYSYASNNPLKYIDPSGYTYGPPIDFKLGKGAFAPLGAKFTMGPRGRVDFNFNTFSNSGFASAYTETFLYEETDGDGNVSYVVMNFVVYKDKDGFVIDIVSPTKKDNKKEEGQEQEDSEDKSDYPDVTDKFIIQINNTKAFFSSLSDKINDLKIDWYNRESIRLAVFWDMVKTNGPFDIKSSTFSEIELEAKKAYFGKDLFSPDDFGNFNFGVAARFYGYSLSFAKFGAGIYQVGWQNGQDWSNWSGFFDYRRDTEMIEKGYNY